MKKVIAGLLVLVLCFGIGGCSAPVSTEPTPEPTATPIPYADADYISDMKKGLQARWDINGQKPDAETQLMDSVEYVEYMKSVINAELGIVSEYAERHYTDIKLQNLAKKYVESLNAQLEALTYYAADMVEYEKRWVTAYNERTKIILTLVDEYGLTVDEKYQTILNSLSENAQVVVKEENATDAIDAIAQQVDFKLVENDEDYGWHAYETTLKNTTEETFAHYTLEISLLDAEGVIIGSAYCDSISNWKPGVKAKLKFTSDEAFAKIEWTANYFVE